MMVIALGMLAWQAKLSRREAGPKEILRPTQVPAERYELLARFEPPGYVPGEGSLQLQKAMRQYVQRDYVGAIEGLRAIIAAHPTDVEARFYLGISLLLANDAPAGDAELRNVIATGKTPFLEQARFYLAKGLLSRGDIAEAQQGLKDVVAMHGDLERQAEALLHQVKP